ncbi:glycoside hydrolase family 99-like domain-containing protein [Bifidobacterium avesanii]|uniref:Glycosyltransferase n=1 Tax=Bifidobacterium avesanii TaxID=1798157 RepID=A0A7K3TIR8_9BIFI|nr:glycoside hydrolase family 99-like domain-containing protein [Bifidobacterium avesanii]KAB8290083.1 glycosyltransferase [Bifidobacterium avesanii]NEG78971.1 glycosyltransferase [Bifidobacterium avesanii]
MKTLALHLPQYYTFPENDKWWGKGFTEWTNVRRAAPLYSGHIQPLVPLNDHYYDLSKTSELVWQHSLARQYGIDGFIYYHYWFNGKLLLEKPVENLLKTKEATQEFCFCWANEPWTRAWDGKNKEIIMPQTFGGEKDWKAHIEYFLPFFKDSRYIRINNQPVLFIYSPNRIPQFDQMIEYWNRYLESIGLEKIYLIEFISTFNSNAFSKYSEAVMEFEPLYSAHYQISYVRQALRFFNKKTKRTDIIDYDYLWQKLLEKNRTYNNRKILRSCFTNFDNSPRKGSRAFITKGATPKKFEKYLHQLISQNRKDAADILVINAWNEWGEGAILEPTEQYHFQWLEAVQNALQ